MIKFQMELVLPRTSACVLSLSMSTSEDWQVLERSERYIGIETSHWKDAGG